MHCTDLGTHSPQMLLRRFANQVKNWTLKKLFQCFSQQKIPVQMSRLAGCNEEDGLTELARAELAN